MNFPRRKEATNKELILTIIEIQGYLSRYGRSHTNWHETLNEVIERFEQQKSEDKVECEAEDCISRKAVLDKAKSYNTDGWDSYTPLVVDVDDIEEMPSVYPKSDKPNTVSEEVYTQEYCARKEAEMEIYRLKRQIEALKSENPGGTWIPHPQAHVHGRGELMCSNCRNDDGCDLYYYFCPYCGAKMDRGEAE